MGEATGVIAPNVAGSLLAGEQLSIYGKDAEGINALDDTVVHSTNMDQLWAGDTEQEAVAPEYGIIAGLKSQAGEGMFKIVPVGTIDISVGQTVEKAWTQA